MDIRKKHVYFMVCSILMLYSMIVSLALLLGKETPKEEKNELTTVSCDCQSVVCQQQSEIVDLQKQLLLWKRLANECRDHVMRKESDEKHAREAQAGSWETMEHEEKMGFHEFLIKDLFENKGNGEQRKQSHLIS